MTRSRFSSASGFTLVELLIVLAIIGLLISLAVPAIQASREVARRAKCTNNQRQYGVAFINFESRNKAFPSSLTLRLKGPLVTDPGWETHNFMVDLLPFLEENTVNNIYHRDAMYCAPENAAAVETRLDVAICPSAPRTELTPTTHLVPSLTVSSSARKNFKVVFDKLDAKYSMSFRGGVSDYAVAFQVEDGLASELGFTLPKEGGDGLPGMFPSPLHQSEKVLLSKVLPILNGPGTADLSIQMRAAQITDGLSHTFMLTEVAGRPDHYRMGVRYPPGEPLESAWADPYAAFQISGFGDQSPKCLLQCDNAGEIYSFHPSGVNFLFADGHVECLDGDTDPRVIVALLTPNQGDNHERSNSP